jgi:predicted DCC family thiol-disulfide oxidoreductase YuxK
VQFIIKRDPNAVFRFASLQSDAGQGLLRDHGLPTEDFDTMVLVEDGSVYTRSTAALRILRRLGGVWGIAYALVVVPRLFRDAVYAAIAKNRYRWFGKREECMLPTPELRARFLE